ncbi:Uncharacterized conserved protein YbjT, contains NAD(P)-binding and DUF2867 domains [Actinosynnema pretiosum]|nr:Uncharacterized conserved protein YbjT, contains NAD(P)-binding and DUF2867 domains [Actinosynnema pretiosum]
MEPAPTGRLTRPMPENPILVTGATGKTGRRVTALLRARGHAVRAASRNSRETPFDWTDPGTWDAALDGVRALYLVQLDGANLAPAFVERAVARGVRRIVLASGRGVDVPGYVLEPDWLDALLDAERSTREISPEWTIVRPGWFAQNFSEGFFADAVRAGEIRLPAGDQAASFVDADDIAEVVVAALTGDGHSGQVYELSGPRALTLAEVAATISGAAGRAVRYVPLTVERYRAELLADGLSESDADLFTKFLHPLAAGLDAHLSDGVRRALGRDPRDFAGFAAGADWSR